MTEKTKKTREFRYRLYFWLMDACFVFAVIGTIDFVLARTLLDGQVAPPWYVPFGIVVLFFNVLLTPFLVVARFMRDEYAEQLWRRTVGVLAYVVAVTPFLFVILSAGTYFALGQPERPPVWLAWAFSATQWSHAVTAAWIGYLMIFVAIFQFLRWRDAR